MTYIDGTDVLVSRLGFGTGSLHHIFSKRRRQLILDQVLDAGITHFDTSPYYGYGFAEIELGKWLRGRRHQFTIATKVGLYPCGPASERIASVLARKVLGKFIGKISLPEVDRSVLRAEASLHNSLRRLGTDCVDFLFLHELDSILLEADETLAWLQREKRQGNIRAWGLAGSSSGILPLIHNRHPLTMVVQAKDSIDFHEADFLADFGRRMQFTYGYLSNARTGFKSHDKAATIRGALERNATGCVLVSTRNTEHLLNLASVIR